MKFREKGRNVSNFGGIARIIVSITHYNRRHFTTKFFRENMNNYHRKSWKNQGILFRNSCGNPDTYLCWYKAMQIWFVGLSFFRPTQIYSPFLLLLCQPTHMFNDVCRYIYTDSMKNGGFILWMLTDRLLKIGSRKIPDLKIKFQLPNQFCVHCTYCCYWNMA